MNTLYAENLDLVRWAVKAVPSWRRDEAAQEARIALWRASERYRGDHSSGASFRTYAGLRVRGAALDGARRDAGARQGRLADYTVTPYGDDLDTVAPALPDPADEATARVDAETILARLPEPQARTLRLRFLEGLTLEEIAQRDGVTASAVHNRVARALKAARRNSA